MKVGFITLGCKVNIYESNALKNELIQAGFEVGEATEDCDCYIINTCSVTNTSDAKSRKMIHKAVKMNPNALCCVMGCYSQTNPDEASKIDGVDILIGNGNKHEAVLKIKEMLSQKRKAKYVNILDILEEHEYENLSSEIFDHTRAFVKIEDGCENFCTYCIIPYARGPIRCKKADLVIEELQKITKMGYKEVVLSGIHTGKYNDGEYNLSGLVRRILDEVKDLKRLRLSSIEINEIDDDFINMMRESDVLANHLHLPLQAGSDKILELMNRRYDTKFFIDKLNKIRDARPDISITTDVIVGFPYEEEKEFMETYEFCKKYDISKIHVFPYSVRRGTKAADMPQVKEEIKKDRAHRLIELSEELEEKYYKRFIGYEMDVIFEQKYDEYLIGHTSNFLQVIVPYEEKYLKENVKVKLLKYVDGKILGSII